MARLSAKATATTVSVMDVVGEAASSAVTVLHTVNSTFGLLNAEVAELIQARTESRIASRTVRREELQTEIISRRIEARTELALLIQENPHSQDDISQFITEFQSMMQKEFEVEMPPVK